MAALGREARLAEGLHGSPWGWMPDDPADYRLADRLGRFVWEVRRMSLREFVGWQVHLADQERRARRKGG